MRNPSHNRRRASFWVRVGDPPVVPGDRLGAQAFVARLERELDTPDQLTESEHRRLRRMLRTWQRRAQGLDVRFNTRGTAPGRATSRATSRKLEEPHE